MLSEIRTKVNGSDGAIAEFTHTGSQKVSGFNAATVRESSRVAPSLRSAPSRASLRASPRLEFNGPLLGRAPVGRTQPRLFVRPQNASFRFPPSCLTPEQLVLRRKGNPPLSSGTLRLNRSAVPAFAADTANKTAAACIRVRGLHASGARTRTPTHAGTALHAPSAATFRSGSQSDRCSLRTHTRAGVAHLAAATAAAI